MKISFKTIAAPRHLLFLFLIPSAAIASSIPISQDPVLKGTSVPGNVALALSVEFPTALVNAHKDDSFSSTKEYLGYFDPMKCYDYKEFNPLENSYFEPVSFKDKIESNCTSVAKWDGNFMNWAITSTIDPFRWVMTGGHRSLDNEDKTFLLKSYDNGQHWADGQLFPQKKSKAIVFAQRIGLTGTSDLIVDVHKQGNTAKFTVGNVGKSYYIQVQVCKANLLEKNCKQYEYNNKKIWKPEGLIQKYARDLRFSAFGYLNDKENVQAGVLRAPMRFVGPEDEFVINRDNSHKEWDPQTGILYVNPSPQDAVETNAAYSLSGDYTIKNSGLINYINKFGQETKSYKANDPVSQLYYAVTKYLQNTGGLPEWVNIDKAVEAAKSKSWSDLGTTEQNKLGKQIYLSEVKDATNQKWDNLKSNGQKTYIDKAKTSYLNSKTLEFKKIILDAFPVINSWDDPIKLSCQKNSILGIGDIFSQKDTKIVNDFDLSNSDISFRKENFDKDAVVYSPSEGSWIADIAYQNNIRGIRTLSNGTKQTAQTFWVDVVEDGTLRLNNQYYRAAKYGGSLDWKSGEKISLYEHVSGDSKKNGKKHDVDRPKNYFLAGDPASMKKGLEEAFEKMSWEAKNLSTTAFSFVNNDLSYNKNFYSISYDSQYWSANIKAHQIDQDGYLEIDSRTNEPKIIWETKDKLAKVIKNDYTKRNLLTWKWGARTNNDVPILFSYDNLSSSQQEALDTSYANGDDGKDFAKWLLGNSADSKYRSRLGAPDANNERSFNPLGDIINSKIVVSGAPMQAYSEIENPGYTAFKDTHKNRENILFVGANDGMLHGIRTEDGKGGEELFAYMPSSFFLPEAGSPAGTKEAVITKLGQLYYNHRNYVDATVAVADVDFSRAGNIDHKEVQASTHDWRSILVGGLGAGGYQYFAIDVSKPDTFLDQAEAPKNLLWEFPRRDQIPAALGGQCSTGCIDIGMTFGTPNIIKTPKYGWVVAVTSGYNNASGKGKLYLLNPTNGNLLETHATTTASNGLAHTTAFMPVYASGLADSIYGGDINGQVWRFDLTGTVTEPSDDGTYPAHLLAKLTSAGNAAKEQPVTTRPIVQVHPKDRKRYVLVGTGRLLDSTDLVDTQEQSFYALVDGTVGRFSSATTTITRSALGKGGPEAVIAKTASPTPYGWVMDLGFGLAQEKTLGWRNIFSASVSGGYVSFSSVLPVANFCEGTGSSRVYAMDFRAGESILPDANSTPQAYLELKFVSFDTQFVRFKGKTRLWIGGGDSQIEVEDKLKFSNESRGQLSWREIPVTR